jgi:outer membrane immunogenic protein
MRNLIVAAAMLAAGGSGAHAADIAARPLTKAPPIAVATLYDWSGFYVGGHGGGAWGDRRWDETSTIFLFGNSAPLAGNTDVTGALAGGQIGYNFQSGPWVFGVQGDMAWTDAKSDGRCNTTFPPPGSPGAAYRCASQAEWLASATVRGGYSWDRSLFYVKGGGAWMEEKYNYGRAEPQAAPFFPMFTSSDTRSGWTVGAGFEYAFLSNWTGFIEYNYYDFGTARETEVAVGLLAGSPNQDLNIKSDLHVVKAGINYKFNWAQPLVARY